MKGLSDQSGPINSNSCISEAESNPPNRLYSSKKDLIAWAFAVLSVRGWLSYTPWTPDGATPATPAGDHFRGHRTVRLHGPDTIANGDGLT